MWPKWNSLIKCNYLNLYLIHSHSLLWEVTWCILFSRWFRPCITVRFVLDINNQLDVNYYLLLVSTILCLYLLTTWLLYRKNEHKTPVLWFNLFKSSFIAVTVIVYFWLHMGTSGKHRTDVIQQLANKFSRNVVTPAFYLVLMFFADTWRTLTLLQVFRSSPAGC